jgi:ATP-dependent DNA helicase RecG
MKENNIKSKTHRLESSESQYIEHKRSFGKEAIISLVAFANSEGGRLLVGMDDTGEVCGVSLGQETVQRYLNEIKVSTYPQLIPKIEVLTIEGKQVLSFEVSEYPIKPIAYKNRYYKRIHNSNHIMSLEEIVDLQQQSLSLSYDAYPSRDAISTLDINLVEEFFKRIQKRALITLQDDMLTNLTKLKLVRDGKATIAAQLLFGDPDFTIRIGRFKSEATIIDDVIVKSPLFTAVGEALTFVKKHINLSYSFDGSRERKERWQYPIEALRELIMNAVVHRDYKNPSDIIIKVFDDRIIISNPGKLYGKLRIADLERNDYVSSLRNRLLAEMFYLSGDIERYGTGFIRIREYLKEYPEISISVEEMGDFFKVDLRLNPPITPPITPPIELVKEANLTELEMKLLTLLKAKPGTSAGVIASQLEIRRDTVKEYLQRLKGKGLLIREGSSRSGRWIVVEPANTN